MSDSETILVMTALPDAEAAARVARAVLESRLAACVNRLAPCESEYWWRGEIETAKEWPLVIKTTQDRYAALEAAIRLAHPYEVPEIVAVPVVAGFAPYLAWVAEETGAAPAGDERA
ncbi:divalent-cation tolerance protein CutA [Cupriavidus sp. 2TAF22]|uniref:divalent-cation tolerance protein CutA n=1 Tax=unclassified Cupriavidus TaxID=2640874 RepID=UPI003F919C29